MPRADRSRFAWTLFGEVPTDPELSPIVLLNLQGLCEPSVRCLAWQCETCPDTGRLHLQGYVRTAANSGIAPVVALLAGLFGGNAHVAVCYRDEEANALYVTKEEGRVHGPYIYGNLRAPGVGARVDYELMRTYIASCTSLDEVYRGASANMFPTLVRAGTHTVERVFNVTRPQPEPLLLPYPNWSIGLLPILRAPAMPRLIHFLVGPPNTGKTLFSLKILDEMGPMAIKVDGSPRDIFHAWNGQRVILLDLPKATRMTPSLAEACETLKTGVVFSTKYQSCMKRYPIPHVVVISNYDPPEEDVLAQDRIVLWRSDDFVPE